MQQHFSFIPTANTCICCLNLPHATHQMHLPTAQNLFPLYDPSMTSFLSCYQLHSLHHYM